jgi:hypothetical protein
MPSCGHFQVVVADIASPFGRRVPRSEFQTFQVETKDAFIFDLERLELETWN